MVQAAADENALGDIQGDGQRIDRSTAWCDAASLNLRDVSLIDAGAGSQFGLSQADFLAPPTNSSPDGLAGSLCDDGIVPAHTNIIQR